VMLLKDICPLPEKTLWTRTKGGAIQMICPEISWNQLGQGPRAKTNEKRVFNRRLTVKFVLNLSLSRVVSVCLFLVLLQ
jgi:hypothetical protein